MKDKDLFEAINSFLLDFLLTALFARLFPTQC